jgi:RNA polymerase sigma-70 factor (ECF subfamily)
LISHSQAMKNTKFKKSVTEEYDPLQAYAYKLTQNTEDARDLVQETMYRAMKNSEKFREGTNLKGWLYTIMKNIFINHYRRMIKSRIFSDESDNQYYLNSAPAVSSANGESRLVLKELWSAVGGLSDNLRIPFVMSYSGYKYEEIANRLNIPLGTVKIRIHIARKKLQAQLRRH